MADWIGSNVEFFPPFGKPELVDGSFDVNCYFGKAETQATDALERLGWLGRVETTTAATFAELFPPQTGMSNAFLFEDLLNFDVF